MSGEMKKIREEFLKPPPNFTNFVEPLFDEMISFRICNTLRWTFMITYSKIIHYYHSTNTEILIIGIKES